MAALAPPPYRPAGAPLTSTAPSSASTANSATPSKKQEQLAAGRRRLEEFKRKKAAEKGKKTSAAASAASAVIPDQPAQNAEQVPVLINVADSSVSPSKQIDSNGHIAEKISNNGFNPATTKGSASAELAASSANRQENTNAISSVSEDLRPSGELFRRDPQVTAVPSGGSFNDGSSIRESNFNHVQELTSVRPTINSVKADGEAGSLLYGEDSKSMAGTAPVPPLGATRPLYTPGPPPVRKEIFGPSTGHGQPETTKNPVAVHPSPFNSIPSSSQGYDNSFHPSASLKPNGGGLVMLDRKLVPSDSAHKGSLPQSGVSEPEQESTSTEARLPPFGGARTESKTDGKISASALSAVPYSNISDSLNTEGGRGSENPPAMNSAFSTLLPPSSAGSKTSVKVSETSSALLHPVSRSDSTAPKFLPLPPPLSRPPISTSTFKPEPFAPVFRNVADSGSSSSSSSSSSTFLSSTAPSNSSFLDNALPGRPNAPPSSFQFPGVPLSAISAIRENGKPEGPVNLFSAVLPPVPSSSSVGQLLSHPVKVAEPVEQTRQPWPPSSGGDDFGMLEQHIEDLTQEKFSLQRGLDAARALAETLAQENSALTEDFNNQGALVNDLKAETERQQGEIRAQAVVVKKMKVERDKAVQDCKAAVQRSQAIAAEVIALEEKVLRARSQELKLQRDMELLSAETESQRRQIASLDKDRANLKTLMEALQEEKGLLQTQIRRATADGGAGDSRLPGPVVRAKADASTSTSDDFDLGAFLQGSAASRPGPTLSNNAVGFEPLEQQRRLPLIIPSLPSRPLPSPGDHSGQGSGSFSLANEAGFTSQLFPSSPGNLSGRSLNLGPVSSVLPSDQATTIANINTLITELAEEKEALVKALKAESVGAGELRTLNAELSHKLEVQTQRLELAVAQSMAASDGTPRVGSTFAVSRVAPEYIDEGDEVVDRVLGWIMQLFPSGSSRRKRL